MFRIMPQKQTGGFSDVTPLKIVRQADTLADEVDEDDALTAETVAYLLEDTDMAYSCRSGTSAELAGKFR